MAIYITDVMNNERSYHLDGGFESQIVPAHVTELYADGNELGLIQAYFRETIPMPFIPARNTEYSSGCSMPVRTMTWYGDTAKTIAYVWRNIICPEHKKTAQK